MLSYVAKHSKQRKTTKVIKLQWLASIWCQKHQNNAKLRKWSNYNELHRFDVKTIKNVELRRKTCKTTQNYKSNQITMTCIDLMSIGSKMLNTSQNIQNNTKLRKWSKYNYLHRFDVKTIKNVELRRKTCKITQNYKSNQITMTCIDLMSKRSKRSKQRKITNAIKLQWICIDLTSIRSKMLNTSQNIQNNTKLEK